MYSCCENHKGSASASNNRAATLVELLLAVAIMGGVFVAHVQALTHVRTLQALSYEREQMVRRGYNLAEELRAGILEAPPNAGERRWSEDTGDFALIDTGDVPAQGLRAIHLEARRKTPQGTIELDLTILLKGEGTGE